MSVNKDIRTIGAAHLGNCPAALGCHDTRNVNSNTDIYIYKKNNISFLSAHPANITKEKVAFLIKCLFMLSQT